MVRSGVSERTTIIAPFPQQMSKTKEKDNVVVRSETTENGVSNLL
jgi:hypothetical protein